MSKLVQRTKLLLINEVTMLNQFQLEALDRTLGDLMDKPNSPFGGKIIVIAGLAKNRSRKSTNRPS